MAQRANVTNGTSMTPCEWILAYQVNGKVRVWDILMLVPSGLFFVFLLLKFRFARRRLRTTGSPIFSTFYGMVAMVASVSVLRCIVSMTVSSSDVGYVADKLLWLIVRFLLLAVELSVITFGLAFGHLDSHESIKRVLIVTTCISLAFSVGQGVLEFLFHDSNYVHIHQGNSYPFFEHGGTDFWLASSTLFFVSYLIIYILPWTPASKYWALPSKNSFYVYVFVLSLLNLVQSIGCCLLLGGISQGLCVVDTTSFLYFAGYAPLVYVTFLKEFFSSNQPNTTYEDPRVMVDDVNVNVYSSFRNEIDFPDNKVFYDTGLDQSTVVVEGKSFTTDADNRDINGSLVI